MSRIPQLAMIYNQRYTNNFINPNPYLSHLDKFLSPNRKKANQDDSDEEINIELDSEEYVFKENSK